MCEISVVLPTYNGSKYIIKSIESIMGQSFQDFELIVIDDCSTDDTYDIVQNYIDEHKKNNDLSNKIKLVRNMVNKKLPESLNVGFCYATGKYWTWTSDDNYYDIDAFEKMYSILEQNESVGIVYADMRLIDSDNIYIKDNILPEPNYIWKRNVVGACFLYRADIAKKVGEYSLDRFLTEDYEYWIRMSNVTTLYHLNEILYSYRIHPASLTATRQQEIIRETRRLRLDYFDVLEKCFKGFGVRKFYNSLLGGCLTTQNLEEYKKLKNKMYRRRKWYVIYWSIIRIKDRKTDLIKRD